MKLAMSKTSKIENQKLIKDPKISIKIAKLGKNRVCESPFHRSFLLPCADP